MSLVRPVPAQVLGREVPERFRRRRLHLVGDPVHVLADFIDWIETGAPPPPPAQDLALELSSAREDLARAEQDRGVLVALCADLHDRLTSSGHRQKVRRALQEAGLELEEPDGECFDPDRHEAVGTVPTDDPGLDDRVASTQRVGYRDRGGLTRAPGVLVYRHEPEEHA